MDAYTGNTQRLRPPDDLTLLSDLLTTDSQFAIQASHNITYQTWALDAARRYLISARQLIEEYHRYQAAVAQHPELQLPPEIAAIVQEVQR
jgi:hypothetical protein